MICRFTVWIHPTGKTLLLLNITRFWCLNSSPVLTFVPGKRPPHPNFMPDSENRISIITCVPNYKDLRRQDPHLHLHPRRCCGEGPFSRCFYRCAVESVLLCLVKKTQRTIETPLPEITAPFYFPAIWQETQDKSHTHNTTLKPFYFSAPASEVVCF